MNIPAFHIHLHEKIQRSQAAIGKLDGKHPILACGTTAGKVFLHEPHNHSIGDNQISYLNINKQLTALTVGKLFSDTDKDVLLLGSLTNLQCYDVEKNQDLFFKDVQDGVQSILVGPYLQNEIPLVIVGGNCSLQGFGFDGTEHFWTVAGDVVTALAFCDVDLDGRRELLVGSDDFDLRVFRNDIVVGQVSEADQFVGLASMAWTPANGGAVVGGGLASSGAMNTSVKNQISISKRNSTSGHSSGISSHLIGPSPASITGASRFGYALSNGTVGVYEKLNRVWRVKSKHSACAVMAMDFDGDGVAELISGWDNGRVEVRRANTGEVVSRDHLTSAVSGLLMADYRAEGRDQLVACGFEGEVRGYLPIDQSASQDLIRRQTPALMSGGAGGGGGGGGGGGAAGEGSTTTAADLAELQQQLADLAQRKQELQYELMSYQSFKIAETSKQPSSTAAMVIPGDTRVDSCIAINRLTSSCDLILSTSNGTLIRGAVIFGEQIFPEESLLILSRVSGSSLLVSLQPLKDVSVVLMMKVLVGHKSYPNFHVFELEIELPKFAMYAHLDRSSLQSPEPKSSVTFQIRERLNRLNVWLEARFNVKVSKYAGINRSGNGANGVGGVGGDSNNGNNNNNNPDALIQVLVPSNTQEGILECCFLSLRSKMPLIFQIRPLGAILQVTLLCDDIDLSGELLQDLCAFLGVEDLNSRAEFPQQMEAFKDVLAAVDEQSATRMKLGADMADWGNLVKVLMVKAEDKRVMGDMKALKRVYRKLYDLIRDLIVEHEKRHVNHAALLKALKEVNLMIQRCSRLRVGPSKTKMITAARTAVKENNMAALFKIFTEGCGPVVPGVSSVGGGLGLIGAG